VLERRLRVGVARQRRLLIVAARHPLLELRQLPLERDQLRGAGQDVVAQGDPAVPWGPLVVERDLRPLGEHQLAAVDRVLAGEHPQQGRLAGPVATRQAHPVAALELERDPAQQRLAADVLLQVRGDHDCHVSAPW